MKAKILVVDDEADLLNMTSRRLSAKGYEVVTAHNGHEALVKAESETPNLILLDVVMPGKSGFEVCRALKGQQRTALTPIIMFTALERDVDVSMGKEAGADGHLAKSVTSTNLISEVERHLAAARLHKFSGQLGLNHDEIKGMNLLFEFDPSTPYERCVRDFVLEARAHGEVAVILTPKASAVHAILSGEEDIELLERRAENQTLLTPILKAHAGERLVLIYDSLTDIALSLGFQAAYRFAKNTLELLVDPSVTTLMLFNPGAHSQKEISSFHALYNNQIAFGSEGLKKVRLTDIRRS